MTYLLSAAALFIAALATLYFSILTYSLRDFSRAKLAEFLGRHNGDQWFESLTEKTDQHIVVTAVFRMLCNLSIWLSLLALTRDAWDDPIERYGEVIVFSALVSLVCSIALPLTIAKYAAESAIGYSAPMLAWLGVLLSPLGLVLAAIDKITRRALDVKTETEPESYEKEILSAVEEGEKEGVVDEQERELIENVIEFRDATAGHIMTARTEIAALELPGSLQEARKAIENSGYSRLPVYEGSLDSVAGILYARDLIKFLGHAERPFDLRSLIRPAMFVPETKPLQNLLTDFRHQKVHIAIVLDEYGGTAGLVTIEDILEELVGEIADEHEAAEPPTFKKTGENSGEADARMPVTDLNRQMGLNLPTDAGYETLAGYLMNSLGRIPEKGTTLEIDGTRFTVLDAEPQKINRVQIELLAAPKARQVG
ncbi:MAG: hemolysin family protein [Tepidisphaeraceae bacterium]|jgi:CBS domain containing-hemolysin-like protein